MQFEGFPKIPRHKRNIVITEKIDGTNAQIAIEPTAWTTRFPDMPPQYLTTPEMCVAQIMHNRTLYDIFAGSRNRWIVPGKDNFGFAGWVHANAEELVKLGPGRHFGEWWGQGIQRRYGLNEKRFSLFNTGRWLANPDTPQCCHVVPLLYAGPHSDAEIKHTMLTLGAVGSQAAPGFMNPEGIVVYHSAGRNLYKVTLDGDEAKGDG